MSNSTTMSEFVILMSANTLEFLVNSVAIPVSVLNFIVIFRASVIHPNLKFILLFQSFLFSLVRNKLFEIFKRQILVKKFRAINDRIKQSILFSFVIPLLYHYLLT